MNEENDSNSITRRKMTEEEIELYSRKIKLVYSRFKKNRRKKKFKKFILSAKSFFKILSQIILWICAVGGFALSLIQFF